VLRNTEATYGSLAKWLHWGMALWFLVAYVIIIYITWGKEGPFSNTNPHKVVGFSILVPLAIRAYWRWTNPAPKLPSGMPGWQVRVSHLSHYFLYFLMLAMPLSGYFSNGGGVNYGIFRIPGFGRTRIAAWIFETFGITYEQWDAFWNVFHYGIVGPWIFSGLVILHASAAIYHHVVQKDNVLLRMLPDNKMSEQKSPNQF